MTMKNSIRQSIIEFARGDIFKRIMAGRSEYMDKDSPASVIRKAVMERSGDAVRSDDPTKDLPRKDVRRTLEEIKSGKITEAEGAVRIQDSWNAGGDKRQKANAVTMIKADIDTNVSGHHGEHVADLKAIQDEARTASKAAGTDTGLAREIKRKAGDETKRIDDNYKAAETRQKGSKKYRLKRPDGRIDRVDAATMSRSMAPHSTAKQQDRLRRGLNRAEEKSLSPFAITSANTDRSRHAADMAGELNKERTLQKTIRRNMDGTKAAQASTPEKITKIKNRKIIGKAMPFDEAGATANKAKNRVASELAPTVRDRIETKAESEITSRKARFEQALHTRAVKRLENQPRGASAVPESQVRPNYRTIRKEADTVLQDIKGTGMPDRRPYDAEGAAKSLGMSPEKYEKTKARFQSLGKGRDRSVRKKIGRMIKSDGRVKEALGGIANAENRSGSLRAFPKRIMKNVASTFGGGGRKSALKGGLIAGLLAGGAAYAIKDRKKKEKIQLSSRGRTIKFSRVTKAAVDIATDKASLAAWREGEKIIKGVVKGTKKSKKAVPHELLRKELEKRSAKHMEIIEGLNKEAEVLRGTVATTARERKSTIEAMTKSHSEKVGGMISREAKRAEGQAKRNERRKTIYRSNIANERLRGDRNAKIYAGIGTGIGAAGGFIAGRTRDEDRKVHKFAMKKDDKDLLIGSAKMGISSGATGAILGGVASLAKGGPGKVFSNANVGRAVKSAGKFGGALALAGTGGALLGSAVIGKPKPNEGGAYTKRGAVGGGIAGAIGGGTLAALAIRNPWAMKQLAKHKGWRPVRALMNGGAAKRISIGAGIGGLVGAGQLADEGQQLDTINAMRKKKKINMSSRIKPITFATGNKVAVAGDRYKKKIAVEEDVRKQRNLIRSTVVGGGVGYLLRKKMPMGSAASVLTGMGAGVAANTGMRAVTSSSRDQFGDIPLQSKKAETLPWKAGALAGIGLMGYRGAKRLKMFSSEGKIIQFGIFDQASQYVAGSVMNQAKNDGYDRQKELDWKRAKRKGNALRRDIDRGRSLISDAGLKIKGKAKLDERGRERKNEWDKSWVRNAAIGAGLTGVALVAHRGGRGVRATAKLQREGKIIGGDGPAGLYNAVRTLVRGEGKTNSARGLFGTKVGKAIRKHPSISRPLIRARRDFINARKDATEITRIKSNKVTEGLQKATGSNLTPKTTREAQERYEAANKALEQQAVDKAAKKNATVERLRRVRRSYKDVDLSSKGKIIKFAVTKEWEIRKVHGKTARIAAPGAQYRDRRSKEELGKETIAEERARHRQDKINTTAIGIGTGGAGIATWNRFSPGARKMRAAVNVSEEEIVRRAQERYDTMTGGSAAHIAERERVKAARAADKGLKKLSKNAARALKAFRR